MKKIMYKTAVAAIMLSLVGCASTKTDNVTVADRNDQIILDWYGRGVGVPVAPEWLTAALQYDYSKMDTDSNRKMAHLEASGKFVEQAKASAKAEMATAKAAELKTKVNSEIGRGITSDKFVEEFDALKSKAQLSGIRIEREFWQKVRNTKTKPAAEEIKYYIVYSFNESDWDAMLAAYRNDVISSLKDSNDIESKQKINKLFDELDKDEKSKWR